MRAAIVLLISTAFTLPGLPPANDAPAPPEDRTILTVDNTSYIFPFSTPSVNEIVKALPQPPPDQTNLRITCELIIFREEAAKHYPLVGRARLQKVLWKCTLSSADYREVVYCDHERLVKVP